MSEWEQVTPTIWRRDLLDLPPQMVYIQPNGFRTGISTGLLLSPASAEEPVDSNWLKSRWKSLRKHAPLLTIYINDDLTPPRLEYDESFPEKEADDSIIVYDDEGIDDPFQYLLEEKGWRNKKDTAILHIFPCKKEGSVEGSYWVYIQGAHMLMDVYGIYTLFDKLLSDEQLNPQRFLPGSMSTYGVKSRPDNCKTPGKGYHLSPDITIPTTYTTSDWSKEETKKLIDTVKNDGVSLGLVLLMACSITKYRFSNKDGDYIPTVVVRDLRRYINTGFNQKDEVIKKSGLTFVSGFPICPSTSTLETLSNLYDAKGLTPKLLVEPIKDILNHEKETDQSLRVVDPYAILPFASFIGKLDVLKTQYNHKTDKEEGWNVNVKVSDLQWCALVDGFSIAFNSHTFDGKLQLKLYSKGLKDHKLVAETWLGIIRQVAGIK